MQTFKNESFQCFDCQVISSDKTFLEEEGGGFNCETLQKGIKVSPKMSKIALHSVSVEGKPF